MRTAVVRVVVDPDGRLSDDELRSGMAALVDLAEAATLQVIDNDLAGLPPQRREVEILMVGDDAADLQVAAIALCARAFGTEPVAGVVTFVSHGTDEDALGVLAGFGLTGHIDRRPGADGWDIITVTLRRTDMLRIPESRVHTALEASTNCEIHIVLVD
ncbi:hypothetical protein MJO55_18855 [Mycolicibacterium rufum]|uniref:Uncharacterized protein n=1 Tax=Mycolicibacterium rufum TaxID=318424 RepID=A0A9X2YFS3_9MYCO|nr:hypothetical protein [Mycolicibacterium rufum]KGI69148.1 hypothetical protein EU78_18835 [Mycolicibacterium rufum]MCV7072933.1 hypothetical protein [Mycolicibacterium rufum]ULP35335.1 hypothetical protein MJO55_18855 [Mycolicibacterium rufum]